MKIAIVGAGIMGLATAWALVQRGHEVQVFDQGPVPNPASGSVDHHRLIRYPYGAKDGYCRMVGEAFGAWERLWRDLGERFYVETCTLALSHGEDDWAGQSRASLERCGITFESIDGAELTRRYPFIDARAFAYGCYLPSGGLLLAGRIMAALSAHLGERGVAIVPQTRVTGFDADAGEIALADGTRIGADRVVLAPGSWTGRLLPRLARRIVPSRQVVVYLEPPPAFAAAWQQAPMILDIDAGAGFYAVPPRPGFAMKVADHRFTLSGDPDAERIVTRDDVDRVLDRCRQRLNQFESYAVLESRICFYDVAPEERFVVEPLGGRGWLLAGFSGHGFKFGPLIGERLAETVQGDGDGAMLTRWAAGLANASA